MRLSPFFCRIVRMRIATALLICGLAAGAQDRLPPIPADRMTDAQKKAAADYKELR